MVTDNIEFTVVPLALKMYIIVGERATGKSYFANSLKNVYALDDITHNDLSRFVWKDTGGTKLDLFLKMYNTNYDLFSSFLLITNDISIAKWLKEHVSSMLALRNRINYEGETNEN